MNTPNKDDRSSDADPSSSDDTDAKNVVSDPAGSAPPQIKKDPSGCSAWAPAIIAGGALLGMLFFIACAGGTYYLFQQRGEFALRTIEGTLIPLLEQSRLQPEDKTQAIDELEAFIVRGRSGELENWQIAGVMQRLVRAPLVSWGDIQYVDSIIQNRDDFSDDEKSDASRDLSRLQRGAELDRVTQFEMGRVFSPISKEADHESGYKLNDDFTGDDLREFLTRVRLVAERAQVPEKAYDVKVADLIRRQIAAGIESGMK
ncbi:MAG: hypothetical protein R3C05_19870 [Pirellulaceae bacterium]